MSALASHSSSSDSGRSGTSTPSSEFAPLRLYLLSPSFIDGNQLSTFAASLEKGYGDKMVLAVAHEEGVFNDPDFDVQSAIRVLSEAVAEVQLAGKQWTKVLAGGSFYLTDSPSTPFGAPSSIEAFEEAHHEEKRTIHKTHAEALNIFSSSSLRVIFSVPLSRGTVYLLERPQVSFAPLPATEPFSVPTVADWEALWAAWDLVTLGMIPPSMLHQKPIDLRHKCLFYIGHIPTFLDMLMSNALKEPNTEPQHFTQIFERGIDPHVDDPDHCHRHSEVPQKDEDWPTLGTILAFRDRVRARLRGLYDDFAAGRRTLNRHLGRMLALTFEHEGWHVETLLYMLIQRAGTGTLPPPGFTTPPWASLAAQWDATTLPPSTPTVMLGPTRLTLGHDDCEGDDLDPTVTHLVSGHEFGWDNESPARQVDVGRVKMAWRPVTNSEYELFWNGGAKQAGVTFPPSWVESEQGLRVRTVHGPVPMDVAKHWPVLTSYDGLLAYAKSKGGRLPTEPELRLFLDTYDVGHAGGSNVGFRNWHPVPATTGLDSNNLKGTNGGIWEWTSTLFASHDGLFPTTHFPGYSTDFFDEKHHVALGGSYATIPRLAGRRTVRNFYQHNYPYPWVGARVAWDA